MEHITAPFAAEHEDIERFRVLIEASPLATPHLLELTHPLVDALQLAIISQYGRCNRAATAALVAAIEAAEANDPASLAVYLHAALRAAERRR